MLRSKMLLRDVLRVSLTPNGGGGYCLAMAPGFFRKYAYVGALMALEEAGLLKVLSCAGTSAGAIVSAFVGGGYTAKQMTEVLFALKREDFWDPEFNLGLLTGLLQGGKLQQTFRDRLGDIENLEDCVVPIGVTAYDALRFRTRVLQCGITIARAVAASCAVRPHPNANPNPNPNANPYLNPNLMLTLTLTPSLTPFLTSTLTLTRPLPSRLPSPRYPSCFAQS